MILKAEDSFTMEAKTALDASDPKVLERESLMTRFQR